MDSPQPIATESRPPARRRLGLRFPLWGLFIVVALACVGAAWYGMRKREREAVQKAAALAAQLETQRQENDRLRAEIGYLKIGDRTKVHALALRRLNDYHWQWRVYLPPGKQWHLYQVLGRIPRRGLNDIRNGKGTIDSGEFTIEAFIGRGAFGESRLVVVTPGRRFSQSIDEGEFEELVKAGHSTGGVGSTKTEVFDAKGPIELIRLRKHPVPGSTADSDEPEFGFMLWFE
jgi:cell division protein FtsB